MAQSTLATFDTWAQLIDHVRSEYPLWYQAPMDVRPARVTAIVRRDGKVRVYPHWASDADPFTADAGHLSRFRRDYSRVTLASIGVEPEDTTACEHGYSGGRGCRGCNPDGPRSDGA